MGDRSSYDPGTFCWVELATSEREGAKAFYTGLFGWETADQPVGEGMVYTMLSLGGKTLGGLFEQREEGVPPHWNSYVAVESADAAAARARELGAELLAEPFDVMEAGRMAVLRDPAGAVVSVWQSGTNPGSAIVNEPGAPAWTELATRDVEAAKRFYGELFGWTFEEAGPGYEVIRNGERTNGGIRAQSEQEAGIPPNWLVYFGAESADDSVARAGEIGGSVLVPGTDIGMGRFAVLKDPQGAGFALFEGNFDD